MFIFVLSESVVHPISTCILDIDCEQEKACQGTHASISVLSALLFHYLVTEEED